MPAELPPRPNLEHLKKQAKDLLQAFRQGEPEAVEKFRPLGGRMAAAGAAPKLTDAQRLVAREYGFASWAKLKAHVESVAPANRRRSRSSSRWARGARRPAARQRRSWPTRSGWSRASTGLPVGRS